MLCALTVRKLKPGTLDQFREVFSPPEDAPPGWKRFYAIRNVDDENEVIMFGLFDGTLDELRAGQSGEYDERRSQAEEFIESYGADGVYEVLEERAMD
jgi:hypothetical protein